MRKAVDLTGILTKEHEKKWVALSRDHKSVIGYHENLLELDKEVEGKDVVYMKVPASNVYLTF